MSFYVCSIIFLFFFAFLLRFFLDSLVSDSIWCWSKLLLLILSVIFFCLDDVGIKMETFTFTPIILVCVDLFVSMLNAMVCCSKCSDLFSSVVWTWTQFLISVCVFRLSFHAINFCWEFFWFCCLNWIKFFWFRKNNSDNFFFCDLKPA